MRASDIAFWQVWLAGAVGAALGDWLSFWVGYHFHDRIVHMWPLSKHPDMVPRAERFIAKWGVPGARLSRPLFRSAAGGRAAGRRRVRDALLAFPVRQRHLGAALVGRAAVVRRRDCPCWRLDLVADLAPNRPTPRFTAVVPCAIANQSGVAGNGPVRGRLESVRGAVASIFIAVALFLIYDVSTSFYASCVAVPAPARTVAAPPPPPVVVLLPPAPAPVQAAPPADGQTAPQSATPQAAAAPAAGPADHHPSGPDTSAAATVAFLRP